MAGLAPRPAVGVIAPSSRSGATGGKRNPRARVHARLRNAARPNAPGGPASPSRIGGAYIDVDLAGMRVLDAGCNRGGFLRLLADRYGIEEGFGMTRASGAVEDARRLAGRRPLRSEVADTVPAGWDGFDVAFSHEGLYLLDDLAAHAETARLGTGRKEPVRAAR